MVLILKDCFLIGFVIFWTIVFAKKIIFWTYLWQLKEYHWARFKSHFSTHNGKKAIFNFLNFFKLILIIFPGILFVLSLQPNQEFFVLYLFLISLIFAAEGIVFLKNLFAKSFAFPKITLKTLIILFLGFLTLFSAIFISFFFDPESFFYYLLLADFFAPLIISFLVFIAHLIAIIWRWNLIKQAMEKRQKFNRLLVVGITGSYGKSSTKEFLYAILKNHFNILKTTANQNSEVGISKCILENLNENHEVFICEMGAYSKGGVRLLSEIAKPKIGILTGINEQHLSVFGSQEKIIATKYELIESLPQEGLAVFNGDNAYCQDLYEKTTGISEKIVFSEIPKNLTAIKFWLWRDLWAETIQEEKDCLKFKLCSKEEALEIKTKILGKHNIANLLMSVVVAKQLGMTLEEIAKEIENLSPELGAIKLKKTKDGLNIIDSSYSANPNGVLADLDYLKNWPGKKIIIMPSLIELGKTAPSIHYKIGEKIAETCDLAIITTRDYFKDLKTGAENKNKDIKIYYSSNPREIKKILTDLDFLSDVILLEGRSPENIKNMIYNL
ncbi:MAG: UDP-N-acetylmuramoyl-tripeptide--D-alanyl-D-alanine ligase [bacterium]|nr:UDP-N-acetylmuramoyl-tripeptide--D-alanyl-D-alanine ligase [bacterium]